MKQLGGEWAVSFPRKAQMTFIFFFAKAESALLTPLFALSRFLADDGWAGFGVSIEAVHHRAHIMYGAGR